MTLANLCASIGSSLPSLFVCSPAPQEGVRVRTPMLYPDGDVVDVFVLEDGSGYTVTDYGDSLGWLEMQSIGRHLSPKQQSLVQDVCQTLRIELFQQQLTLKSVEEDALGEAVLRVAQAAVRISDLWFTLRNKSLQTTANEVGTWLREEQVSFKRQVAKQGLSTKILIANQVDNWLREKQISFKRQVAKQGRSTKTWTVDFEIRTRNRTSLVFLLSASSRRTTLRVSEHVLAGCIDLDYMKADQPNVAFVSLFDDLPGIWREQNFNLVREHSEIARWSRPDEFEQILLGR